MGVNVDPGANPFTIIPYGRYFLAIPKVRLLSPHFEMIYGEMAGRSDDEEVIFRIFPLILFSTIAHIVRGFKRLTRKKKYPNHDDRH